MIKWFNRLHMMVHFSFGVVIALMLSWLTQSPLLPLAFFAILGSFLPDLDHLAFFFTYGRKSLYSRKVVGYLKKAQIREAVHFCAYNHKQLNGLYSHTWYGIVVVTIGALLAWTYSVEAGALFIGMFFHFLYDIVEDVILKGKINSNWYGKVLKYNFVEKAEDR